MITLDRDGRGPVLDLGLDRPLRVSPVDGYALESRAARLAARSIKRESKAAGLELAVRCIDLTTLEGMDTPGKVRSLCARALRPDPDDPTVPPVAAVCVYGSLVAVAAEALEGTGVHIASVAGAFPSGQSHLADRLDEIRRAVADGADEIDIVLNRGALLAGRLQEVFDEVAAAKEACGSAHLKTILETGELGSYEMTRLASMIAMAAGSDVIKTSTGKLPVSATPRDGPLHVGGDPRLRRGHGPRGGPQARRGHPHLQAGARVPGARRGDPGDGVAPPGPLPHRRLLAPERHPAPAPVRPHRPLRPLR